MKTFIFFSLGIYLFCVPSNLIAQGVAVNETGSAAHASAMLDVSSINKGLLIPVMTYTDRNAIDDPATGLLIFQSNETPGFYYFNGTSWKLVGNEALSLNDLTDAITEGYSVLLGPGTGENDDGELNYNVAVGNEALNDNISGTMNVAIGYQALFKNTTNNNHAVGYQSLYNNTTGISNTAFGYQALYSNVGGQNNTAVGYEAMVSNSSGTQNTAMGNFALRYNTLGHYNVGVGYYSNAYNQTGSNNTTIGYQAGLGTDLHNTSGNIFIGYKAGFNETASNKLYIENSTSSSPLIYGEFDNDILAVNGSFGIGTQSPDASAEMEIESTSKGILIPRMTKAQRDAIGSPATGLLIYQTDDSPGFYSYDGGKWKPMTVQGTGENAAGEAGIGSDYGTVVNDATGKVWLDRNLGASQVADSSTDINAYGDLYQGGRAAEGHQLRNSTTYSGPVNTWIPRLGTNGWDSKFITISIEQSDWLSTPNDDLWKGSDAENNPCPSGFRIPNAAEWVQEVLTWSSADAAGAFASPLKLPSGGYRYLNTGSIAFVGTQGAYWASTTRFGDVISVNYSESSTNLSVTASRGMGYTVRCIKE